MAQRSQMRESVLLSVPGERGLGENLMKCIFTSGERTGRTAGLTLDKATRVLPNMIRGMSWGNGGQPTLSCNLPTHRFSTHKPPPCFCPEMLGDGEGVERRASSPIYRKEGSPGAIPDRDCTHRVDEDLGEQGNSARTAWPRVTVSSPSSATKGEERLYRLLCRRPPSKDLAHSFAGMKTAPRSRAPQQTR